MNTILLSTVWDPDYFETDKEAPYPKFNYNQLANWNNLANELPLRALGIYKGNNINQCFTFLKVVGMRHDDLNAPHFDFRTISRSNVTSSRLIDALPTNIRRQIFSSIDYNVLLNILKNIGANLPQEWLNTQENIINPVPTPNIVNDAPTPDIVNNVTTTSNYLDFIGDYYKRLLTVNLNNDEFEDLTASLLIALGFSVTQRGHNVVAAVTDGVASFENKIALVYDCKNSNDFVLREDFKRAINQYVNDERRRRNEEEFYPVFISRGFVNPNCPGFHCFTIDSLLYLLYKKLLLGNKFSLRPMSIILTNNSEFSKNRIDIEWPS